MLGVIPNSIEQNHKIKKPRTCWEAQRSKRIKKMLFSTLKN